jgi:hypothetical protein
LEATRLAVYEALVDVHPDLGRWYYGAIHVLADPGNPEAPYQAAHSLRELMEKLPKYRDIPITQGTGVLRQLAREIREWWETWLADSGACRQDQCELQRTEVAGMLQGLTEELKSGMSLLPPGLVRQG